MHPNSGISAASHLVHLLQVIEPTTDGANFNAKAAWAFKDDLAAQEYRIEFKPDGTFTITPDTVLRSSQKRSAKNRFTNRKRRPGHPQRQPAFETGNRRQGLWKLTERPETTLIQSLSRSHYTVILHHVRVDQMPLTDETLHPSPHLPMPSPNRRIIQAVVGT